MTDKSNIEDVTNSSEDWEDFWNMGELGRTKMKKLDEIPPYVEAIVTFKTIDGKNDCKRESPLSE